MQSDSPAHSAKPTLPALTGLRFVAALSVVFFHYQFLVPGFAKRITPGANIVHSGFVGVSLFFVLSGFILAYTYLSPGVGMIGSLDAFWQARVARVYPVYLFALIFSAPLFIDVAFFHQVGVTHLRDVIKTAILTPLLLQGWTPKKAWMWDGPAWSLSAEAFFYLLFPFIGARVARLRTKWIFIVATAAYLCALAGPLLYGTYHPDGLGRVTPTTYGPWIAFMKFSPVVHLPEFVIGVCAGAIFLRRRTGASAWAKWVAMLTLMAIVVALMSGDVIPFLLLNDGVLAPLFAALIYALAAGPGLVADILSTKLMQLLGGASYALYLLHLPLSNYLDRAWIASSGKAPAGLFALASFVLAAVALSVAVYRWIEVPARSWLRRKEWRFVERVRALALTPVRMGKIGAD